jgi:hypothetical protein
MTLPFIPLSSAQRGANKDEAYSLKARTIIVRHGYISTLYMVFTELSIRGNPDFRGEGGKYRVRNPGRRNPEFFPRGSGGVPQPACGEFLEPKSPPRMGD